jgi:hypothetical protein
MSSMRISDKESNCPLAIFVELQRKGQIVKRIDMLANG